MDVYKTPRDKLICILNCCKILYSVAARATASGADDLLPLLIVVLLRFNPLRLRSHVDFIAAYRRPPGLMTEPGYYFTQLLSAIAFIEQCDASRLTIAPADYDAFMQGGTPPAKLSSTTTTTTTTTTPLTTTTTLSSSTATKTTSSTLSTKASIDFVTCDASALSSDDVKRLLLASCSGECDREHGFNFRIAAAPRSPLDGLDRFAGTVLRQQGPAQNLRSNMMAVVRAQYTCSEPLGFARPVHLQGDDCPFERLVSGIAPS